MPKTEWPVQTDAVPEIAGKSVRKQSVPNPAGKMGAGPVSEPRADTVSEPDTNPVPEPRSGPARKSVREPSYPGPCPKSGPEPGSSDAVAEGRANPSLDDDASADFVGLALLARAERHDFECGCAVHDLGILSGG